MADGYLLSEEDLVKLKKLFGEHGMSRLPHQGEDPVGGSPEVYIAKVQDDPDTGEPGSIPAVIAAGTDDYDHPGCAVCDIYQVMSSSSAEDWDLVPISNLSFPVYNLSTGSISSNSWLLVVRDKSGRWVATTGNAGSSVYQIIDTGPYIYNDMDDLTYWAAANPGEINPSTGFLYDPHAGAIGDWSVAVHDVSGLMPCWRGEWVDAEPLTVDNPPFVDVAAPYYVHADVQLTNRRCHGLWFPGTLGVSNLYAGGSASAIVQIHANALTKTVYDAGLLLPGQALLHGSPFWCVYNVDTRRFEVPNAPCNTVVTPE